MPGSMMRGAAAAAMGNQDHASPFGGSKHRKARRKGRRKGRRAARGASNAFLDAVGSKLGK